MSLPDVSNLQPVLAHLSSFGECCPAELERSARPWLDLLAEAGWLLKSGQDVFVVTQAFLTLGVELTTLDSLRRVCFAVPAYRRYLMAVLAEGLVTAGLVDDFQEQLEKWIVGDLALLAPEINAILDDLEDGQRRMIEWSKQQIEDRFRSWHHNHPSFAPWDAVLLSLSGMPEQLFTAVMTRSAAFVRPGVQSLEETRPLAFLPMFDLPKDDAGRLALPAPAAWSRARHCVHSSVPLYALDSRPLYDQAQPIRTVWQDVLAQQPYYRAVLRIAIVARFSLPNAGKLVLSVTDDLAGTQVHVEGRPGKPLVQLLSPLVEAMGFRSATPVEPGHVWRILEQWMAVEVLEKRDGDLQLQESYAATLHERRRRKALLCDAGAQEQNQVKLILKDLP